MEGEEQTNTVFVGSIAPDTDDRALREFFNQFGRVLETKVPGDLAWTGSAALLGCPLQLHCSITSTFLTVCMKCRWYMTSRQEGQEALALSNLMTRATLRMPSTMQTAR